MKYIIGNVLATAIFAPMLALFPTALVFLPFFFVFSTKDNFRLTEKHDKFLQKIMLLIWIVSLIILTPLLFYGFSLNYKL